MKVISKTYAELLGHTSQAYSTNVCVYAISASNTAEFAEVVHNTRYNDLAYNYSTSEFYTTISNPAKVHFARANSSAFMCYKFAVTDVETDSDTESEFPYSYQELFNEPVSANLTASTGMNYGYEWSMFNEGFNLTRSRLSPEYMRERFLLSNKVHSANDFSRQDYYKFFVPETQLVRNRSSLMLSDLSASVSNLSHDTFNGVLYCVNYSYDNIIGTRTVPKGFDVTTHNVYPMSYNTYDIDMILAGKNIVFEPSLYGIVNVEQAT